MAINDSDGSMGYEVVSDVLDGFAITAEERIRIEERADQLLTLDASLRALRIAAGVPQHDVAAAMGVTNDAVDGLEARDLADTKLGTLARYFAGLGYRLDFALTPLDS